MPADRTRPRQPRQRIEDDIQIAVINTAILYAGQCPTLRRLYAILNGGKRPKPEAARMKAMGGRAGIPDLHLPVGRLFHIDSNHPRTARVGRYLSLYIEMKRPGGKLSPDQVREIAELRQSGNCVQVCDSLDSAWAVLCWYLSPQWSDAGRAFREVCGVMHSNILLTGERLVLVYGSSRSLWFEGRTPEEAASFLRFMSAAGHHLKPE